jgi:hypothetical protein
MYDVNVEHFGWNKRENETAVEYIKRVWSDDYLETTENNAFADMSFERAMEVNDLCLPQDKCYYFSYTTGIKQKVSNDRVQVETNPKIKNFTNDVIGFDIEKVNRMEWQDIARPEKTKTFIGKIATFVKQA